MGRIVPTCLRTHWVPVALSLKLSCSHACIASMQLSMQPESTASSAAAGLRSMRVVKSPSACSNGPAARALSQSSVHVCFVGTDGMHISRLEHSGEEYCHKSLQLNAKGR